MSSSACYPDIEEKTLNNFAFENILNGNDSGDYFSLPDPPPNESRNN